MFMGLMGFKNIFYFPKKCTVIQNFPKCTIRNEINAFIHLIDFIMHQKQKPYLDFDQPIQMLSLKQFPR